MISTRRQRLSLDSGRVSITDATLVVLVVCLQLIGVRNNLLVQRMCYTILNCYDNGLIHLIGNDLAYSRFA